MGIQTGTHLMRIKDVDKIYRKVSLKPLNVRVTAMEDLQIIALVTTINITIIPFTIFGLAVISLRSVMSAQMLRGSIRKSFFSDEIWTRQVKPR